LLGTAVSSAALLNMTRIIFSDFRESVAEKAYEIAYDYIERSGAMRDEFETCVFLAQRLTAMIDQGHTNKIRMANRAISEYQSYVCERERTIRCRGDC
jgi:hypothetical protein